MNTTFQNSAQVLSIGIFFSLMIVGLSSSLPANLFHGLVANGVSPTVASRASHLPPVSTLFAAFLGVNPVQHLIGPQVLSHLTAAQQAKVTGRSFFPGLITAPFRAGLHAAFDFAIVASLLAAAASWTRGGHLRVPAPTTGDGHATAAGSDNGSRADGQSSREPANAGLLGSQPAIES
jgi:hypothetical protein